MRTPFAIRLAQALAVSEKGEGQVAKDAGVSPGQLSRWKNATADEGPVPLATAVEGLLRAMPGVNGHWLLTGEGDMRLPSGDEVVRLQVIRLTADGTLDEATLRRILADARTRDAAEAARLAEGREPPATGTQQPPGAA